MQRSRMGTFRRIRKSIYLEDIPILANRLVRRRKLIFDVSGIPLDTRSLRLALAYRGGGGLSARPAN